tara:strand:- start:609 stop:2918 length:2310 start_codon:yes stop_codon:yes gene_type:complete
MAHTTFRKSIPYNNIRLGGDVAQWSIYEITSADNGSYIGISGMDNVSMSDMQRASGTGWDPNEGRVNSGLLSPMRYGITSIPADVSSGEGVYAYQVDNTSSPFVTQRQYNSIGTIENVRLSRMAQWDYTAVIDPSEMGKMDFKNGGSTSWQCNSKGMELFRDQQIWGWGSRRTTSERVVIIVRSAKSGDKFSTYPQTNFAEGAENSSMNNIDVLVPFRADYGQTFGTNINSYATFGRYNPSNSRVLAQAYYVNIGSNGTLTTGKVGTAGNFTTGASSNYISSGGCYVRDNLMIVVGGRGASGQYINRISWGGTSFSSTNATLTSVAGNGAARSDVVSTDNFGTANNRTIAAYVTDKSTFNRYCYIQMFNMNSGISTIGSAQVVINASNQLKGVVLDILATDSDYIWILIATTDTSGDVRLNVYRWNYGGNSWTSLASATYQYNDTSIFSGHSITVLTAVEKTTIVKSGENFTPGGTNDFEQRIYFALGMSTNSDTDDVEIQYGYYNIDTNGLSFTDSGIAWTGRDSKLAKNPYLTDARSNLNNLPIRNEAGPVYMPLMGGRYINSTTRNLSFAMLGLDYKPDWGNAAAGDPGTAIISTTGEQYTTDVMVDIGEIEPGWDVKGVWKVIGPHPSPTNVAPTTSGWSLQATNRDAYGYNFAAIGANLNFFTANQIDSEGNEWENFFATLVQYSAQNNTYYVRLSTGNGNFQATFTVAPGKTTGIVPGGSSSSPYLMVDWRELSNSHSGNSWAFLFQGVNDTIIGIEFSQSPF